MIHEKLRGRVFHIIEEFSANLDDEVGVGAFDWGLLRYVPDSEVYAFWVQNIWLDPFKVEFDSISEAASCLRGVQGNWAAVPFACFRRMELIRQKLPSISDRARPFPWLLPESAMGAWTLLDAHTLLASARCSSPFPAGRVCLLEDLFGPPSRAYLKLQEALIRARVFPRAQDRCIDAGAAPGGWSWVLAGLGAQVVAIDRAVLDPRVSALPNVEYLKHDAFTFKPAELGKTDWLFSDVVCYPPRLYAWIEEWLVSGLCQNFVCTIKMQGAWDRETTERFAAIPGSFVVHLCNNKHELTWIKTESSII